MHEDDAAVPLELSLGHEANMAAAARLHLHAQDLGVLVDIKLWAGPWLTGEWQNAPSGQKRLGLWRIVRSEAEGIAYFREQANRRGWAGRVSFPANIHRATDLHGLRAASTAAAWLEMRRAQDADARRPMRRAEGAASPIYENVEVALDA